jgi:paraquat-inducible protein A
MESPAVIACHVCGQVHQVAPVKPGMVAECVRCHARLERRSRGSLHRTAALSLAALLLYVPANVLPILHLELYGRTTENTVWDGVRKFYEDGSYVICTIVLLASIIIPLVKLMGLFYVTITTGMRSKRGRHFRTWVFRFIDTIGKWAMLDVFVVGIWISAVKMGSLTTVSPGRGLLPFGCVVVLTLLASASFDPQLIWEPDTGEGVFAVHRPLD